MKCYQYLSEFKCWISMQGNNWRSRISRLQQRRQFCFVAQLTVCHFAQIRNFITFEICDVNLGSFYKSGKVSEVHAQVITNLRHFLQFSKVSQINTNTNINNSTRRVIIFIIIKRLSLYHDSHITIVATRDTTPHHRFLITCLVSKSSFVINYSSAARLHCIRIFFCDFILLSYFSVSIYTDKAINSEKYSHNS